MPLPFFYAQNYAGIIGLYASDLNHANYNQLLFWYDVFSNVDTETYDDVISEKINHPIYEIISNKDYDDVGVGDDSSHAVNSRYIYN